MVYRLYNNVNKITKSVRTLNSRPLDHDPKEGARVNSWVKGHWMWAFIATLNGILTHDTAYYYCYLKIDLPLKLVMFCEDEIE